jgi:hypothetical protein
MALYNDDVVAEVRQTRAQLLAEYGGMKGYLNHLAAEIPRWQRDGWEFTTIEETLAKKAVSA